MSPADTFFAPAERLDAAALARQCSDLENLDTLIPVFDSMPDVVMILNRQRQIIYGNKVLRELAQSRHCLDFVGLRPGELLDCRQAGLAPGGCGTGEACRTCGAVNAILAGLSGQSANLECHIGTRLNDALDLRIFANPFRWHEEDYVLVVASDISDQKRRQVLERIFFHDILNTAGGLQSIAELISLDSSTIKIFSADLLTTAEALVNEIKSQRLLLAAENRELQVEAVPLTSRAQLEAAANVYHHHPVAAQKKIVIDPEADDIAFLADPTLLQRVLGNLLKNALEACRPGDTVRLGCSLLPHQLCFWVANPGCMPREAQLQVFQRSFSTKGAGRGIGTYSVKLLTERYLGGEVCFTSSHEEGTCFQVQLPIKPA